MGEKGGTSPEGTVSKGRNRAGERWQKPWKKRNTGRETKIDGEKGGRKCTEKRKITQSLLLRPQGKGREQIPQARVSFPPPLLVLAGNLSSAIGTAPDLLLHTCAANIHPETLWW